MTVRGPGAIAALCLRCLVVLAGVNAVGLGILVAVAGEATGMPFGFLLYVLLVAAVPVAVVGFPAGLITARLLADVHSERVHVAVFALVGGVLSVALCAWWGLLGVAWWSWLLAFAEGVVGAGGARWWTGRVHARRVGRPDTPEAALPSARMGP